MEASARGEPQLQAAKRSEEQVAENVEKEKKDMEADATLMAEVYAHREAALQAKAEEQALLDELAKRQQEARDAEKKLLAQLNQKAAQGQAARDAELELLARRRGHGSEVKAAQEAEQKLREERRREEEAKRAEQKLREEQKREEEAKQAELLELEQKRLDERRREVEAEQKRFEERMREAAAEKERLDEQKPEGERKEAARQLEEGLLDTETLARLRLAHAASRADSHRHLEQEMYQGRRSLSGDTDAKMAEAQLCRLQSVVGISAEEAQKLLDLHAAQKAAPGTEPPVAAGSIEDELQKARKRREEAEARLAVTREHRVSESPVEASPAVEPPRRSTPCV